jgi:hypothetical protein
MDLFLLFFSLPQKLEANVDISSIVFNGYVGEYGGAYIGIYIYIYMGTDGKE